jgi:arginine deiminase
VAEPRWDKLRVDGELGWLRRVLVCSPGEELRRVPPAERDRYLVEDILWLERAQEQHAAFVRALGLLMAAGPAADAGAPPPEVVDLRVALRAALGDRSTEVAADELLEEVCRLEPNLEGAELDEELAALRARLRGGGAGVGDDLLAGVLAERPAPGRELFRICPSPNVMFARDYQFVLGGGAFLSSMAKRARAKEPAIARFVFEHALGLPDVSLDVHALARGARAKRRLEGVPGHLRIEGGDVMALGRGTILVGISERTTWRGATALALGLRWLRQRDPAAFPFTELCAVELPPKRAMMHLDTVFTLVDHGLALAYPPLTFPGAREEMPVSSCDLGCDPEAPAPFRYEGPFADAMARRLSSPDRPLTLIAGGGERLRFQHREQWCDACNAFAVGPGVAVSYDRNDRTLAALRALDTPTGALVATPGHARAPAAHLRPFLTVAAADLTAEKARDLVDAGERVMVCIEGGELGRARGGPHCMTMALVREAER